MLRWSLIASILISILTWLSAPWISPVIRVEREPLTLSVRADGARRPEGWFSGSALAAAQSNEPQAVITFSLNGSPVVQGAEILLTQSGSYTLVWKACVKTICAEPVTQFIRVYSAGPPLLRYDPALHKWSFSGTVIEIRQVWLLGMPARIARVQSSDFEAWVIQRTASQSAELADVILGDASVGDQVRVSITGSHVSKNGVNWDLCQPLYSNYCRQGGLYDNGPLSLDWNIPLSPSNEFIHYSQPNPSWEQALFWNTEKVSLNDEVAPGFSKHRHNPEHPKPRWPGCLALLGGTSIPCRKIASNDAARLPFLVENPITWGTRGMHAARNLHLAEWTASWAGRVRVPPGADGNLLVGNSGM